MKLEILILSSLIHNTDYARSVLPFVRADYFADANERTVFSIIDNFYKVYNTAPNTDALFIELQNNKQLRPSTKSRTQYCRPYMVAGRDRKIL
jgi:replicative DNA helicase